LKIDTSEPVEKSSQLRHVCGLTKPGSDPGFKRWE
jgi:hypothetical protein